MEPTIGVVYEGRGAADGGVGGVHAVLGQCSYVWTDRAEWGGVADPVRGPPPPQPLLYLPMVVGGKMIRALLDSGASDSFVSWDVVRVLRLRQYPLS